MKSAGYKVTSVALHSSGGVGPLLSTGRSDPCLGTFPGAQAPAAGSGRWRAPAVCSPLMFLNGVCSRAGRSCLTSASPRCPSEARDCPTP